MKKRNGFVSNSSSSSFIITNKSDRDLSLVDFVRENPQLVEQWRSIYGSGDYNQDTQEELLESAEMNNFDFPANSSDEYIFGDEEGTKVGKIFDYILRDGGESENFKWNFCEYYR
jgi:hypothetical protein